MPADSAALLRLGGEQFGVAADGREHVVEVMRDATRQRADRLKSLDAPKLLLELTTLRHIAADGDESPPSVRRLEALQVPGNAPDAMVGAGDRGFELQPLTIEGRLGLRVDLGAGGVAVAEGEDGPMVCVYDKQDKTTEVGNLFVEM